MRGTNPIRKPLAGDGDRLEVKEIFSTLQGEGPFAGWPSVFVRLGGCNLACDFCDTQFEDFAEKPIIDIAAEISRLSGGRPTLIVITGGEPLRQNIAPLCTLLLSFGHKVQIETNGTLYRPLPPEVHIVCSPKNTQGHYAPVRPDLLEHLAALKFLIAAGRSDYDHVPDVGQGAHRVPVYLQPMDEYDAAKNMANLALATKLAREHGHRLSLQLHKIAGIP